MHTNIFVTDIVGYSKITGDDQKLALELLKEHDTIIEPIIKRYNGIIFKRIGDAIIATYNSSNEMIQASIEIQQNLKNRNNRNIQNRQLILRIGLHYGEVIMQNDELYGDGYSVASDIEPICKFGGISISETLYKQVHENNEFIVQGVKNHFFIRPVAFFTFKNSNKPILIYNLYLNLLDWYDDTFDKTHSYLAKQGISQNIYEPYQASHNFLFEESFCNANNFYKNHNLSNAVYHYKMCIDYGNGLNKDSINLLILKIFSECGLHRLVNRVITKLNIKDNNFLTLTKGINLFNEQKWDEAAELFTQILNSDLDKGNIEAIYYYMVIIYHNDDKNRINKLIESLLPIVKNQNHINILTLINNILNASINDVEVIFNKFENDTLYKVMHHKFLLFIHLIVIQLYLNANQRAKAVIFQNKALSSIKFLSNKIFGFQLQKLFNKNPVLHKKLKEPLDINFIEEVEGLDGLDLDIDHLIKSKQENNQFCIECSFKNSIKFKYCISCGVSLA